MNNDLDYLENGGIYELSLRNGAVKLIGVFCNPQNELHNFFFQVVDGKDFKLAQQITFDNSPKPTNGLYSTYIQLKQFAALGDSLDAEYMGQTVFFRNGKDTDYNLWDNKLFFALNTQPFFIKPVLSYDGIPPEIMEKHRKCTTSELDLSWFKTTFVTLDLPKQDTVKKPENGATLRQKLAVLKHVMRTASVTNDDKRVEMFEKSVTFQNLVNGIKKDINAAQDVNTTNASSSARKFSLRKTALCLLSVLRGKDELNKECQKANSANASNSNSTNGLVTPPINETTPTRQSNASNVVAGGKAKNTKEYKIYNKRRYVVRQGKRGGKYIQIADKKVYI